MPHIYSLRFGMILDNLFTELRRLENASNKLSVSKFDNPCLNIFVFTRLLWPFRNRHWSFLQFCIWNLSNFWWYFSKSLCWNNTTVFQWCIIHCYCFSACILHLICTKFLWHVNTMWLCIALLCHYKKQLRRSINNFLWHKFSRKVYGRNFFLTGSSFSKMFPHVQVFIIKITSML